MTIKVVGTRVAPSVRVTTEMKWDKSAISSQQISREQRSEVSRAEHSSKWFKNMGMVQVNGNGKNESPKEYIMALLFADDIISVNLRDTGPCISNKKKVATWQHLRLDSESQSIRCADDEQGIIDRDSLALVNSSFKSSLYPFHLISLLIWFSL